MILFKDIATSDLIMNEIYRGGTNGNQSDEVLSKIFRVGNSGGFRYRGSVPDNLTLLVLYSSNEHSVWRDRFDNDEGVYIYYGDNDSHENKINETVKHGNLILENLFNRTNRNQIPPIFIFQKVKGRDMKFIGLAVPSSDKGSELALRRVRQEVENEKIVLNYEARFTILNEGEIDRRWIDDIVSGKGLSSEFTPVNWNNWRKGENFETATDMSDDLIEINYEQRLETAEILAYYIARFGADNCSKLLIENQKGLISFVRNYLDFEKPWFLKVIDRYQEFLNNENMRKMKNPPKNIYGIVTQYDNMNNLAVEEYINKMLINIIEGRHDVKVPLILKEKISDSFKAEYTTAKTGKAAEELFFSWYKDGVMQELKKYKDIELEDTRLTDLGYDFSMNGTPGYLFEVKGLKSISGSVRFTQNEWQQAQKLADKYFLVLIYDLENKPKYKIVRNPFNTLNANLNEQYVKQISWHINTKEIIAAKSLEI